MSSSVSLHPITKALMEGYKLGRGVGPLLPNPVDPPEEQQAFLRVYDAYVSDLAANTFTQDEIQSIAAMTADEINSWLAARGFEIKLKQFTEPDQYGVGVVMDVSLGWASPGQSRDLVVGGVPYSGALLDDAASVLFHETEGYPHPVVRIKGKRNSGECLIAIADQPREGLDLINTVQRISQGRRTFDYGQVHFPKVDLNVQPDISWVEGVAFQGVGPNTGTLGRIRVVEAKQQNILKLNHQGARAKSGVTMAFSLESAIPVRILTIDQPFFVWFTRDGLEMPFFAAYVTPDDWKDPGDFGIDEEEEIDARGCPACGMG